ncbi:MAG TPA: GMC family oxidoreductase [Thermomicrobiales bacterium]|nr:GMC family oxidoreductase [Thermomicrobiales bacterium]
MAEQLEADVVIVGAGVAGTLVGWSLARAGARVLILEAGPAVDRARAVKTFRAALAKAPNAPYPDVPYAPRPKVTDLRGYYVQAGPDLFKSAYERQVGGTTWHWNATAMRHLPSDFAIRSRYGVGVDWPITYAQLEPWYVAAERQLGVAGDDGADFGSPRSQRYPLPPIAQTYLDRQVEAAAATLGIPVLPTPQARNSVSFQGRPACCGNSTCVPLCPIGAKYDASVHAKLAQAAGARLVEQAIVSRIDVGPDGKVSGLRFKRPDGSEQGATGRVYVLAAHAIETPKLLLMSRSDRLPHGVANSSDQVGRNLMDHVTQVSLALTKNPVYPYRGPGETSGIEQYRDGAFRASQAAFRTPIGNDGWSFGGQDVVALVPDLVEKRGLLGAALREEVRRQGSRQLRFAALVEQLPDPENRVTPAFDQLDPLGLPRPRLAYRVDDYTHRGMATARQLADRVFDALGVLARQHVADYFGAGHIIGTYRMGADPKTSVVDARQRAHDHPNLFLVGSGVYPTGATANPTLTIAALALWAADTIRKDLGR